MHLVFQVIWLLLELLPGGNYLTLLGVLKTVTMVLLEMLASKYVLTIE